MIDRLHTYLPGWEIPKNSKDILTTRYGFVTDYLAEAFRALRKQNRFDAVDRFFRFGSHVEGRDATAARKTVSGFLKILHPHGEFTKDELREYVELALELRRRVKEQLKKRGSFEFYKTSFSYIDLADDVERTVGVPEQGGSGAISQDPLPPGTVYTASYDDDGKVGLYRLEVALSNSKWAFSVLRALSPPFPGASLVNFPPPAHRPMLLRFQHKSEGLR